MRKKPGPRVTVAETFDSHWVERPNGCREWQRALDSSGYGKLVVNGSLMSAHRFAWERVKGVIPHGMQVLHRCDNPLCVNPEHLFIGTNTDNRRDCVLKRRHAHGERHGWSKLSDTDVERIRDIWRVGGVEKKEIAEYFGVDPSIVSLILSGKIWKHLEAA